MFFTEGEMKKINDALNNPDETEVLRDKFFAELDRDIIINEEDGYDEIRILENEEQEVICNDFYSINELYDESLRFFIHPYPLFGCFDDDENMLGAA